MSDTAPTPRAARGQDLVRPGSRSDRVVTAVAWWSPEIATAGAVGTAGTLLWHPAVAAAAGVLLAGRVAAAHLANARAHRDRTTRRAEQAAHVLPTEDAQTEQSGEVRSA